MKTSITKSHSVYSNFKLTIMSVLMIIFVSVFIFTIIVYKYIPKKYFIVILITSGMMVIVMHTLFSKFKR